jgi:type I restriction enzyme S subunit
LRFSGFDDEWKTYKLKDLLHNKSSSISINQLDDNVGNYPLYGASGFLKCIDFYEMDSDYISIVKDGSGVGNISFHEKNTSVVNTSQYILPKENLNIHFIFYLLQTINLNKYKTGSTIPHIYFKDYSIEKVKVPKYDEQKKIGILLKNLDAKIEILDNKLQMCPNFKKYLMQQIFTQKLRFDDNCQYKTKQVKDFLIESKIEGIDDINKRLTVKLNLKGITVRESKTIEIEGATKQFIRKTGQFIYGKQNLHKGAFGIIPKELDGYLTSSDIPSFDFKGGIEPKWFYYYFARKSFYEKLENLSTGTGSKRISPKEFLNIKIIVPEFKEQHKIVCLLEKFDEKINGISNQIVQMNMFKKSLLQQMFVVQLILSLLQNKKHI